MPLEFRPIADDEFPAFAEANAFGFAGAWGTESVELQTWRRCLNLTRTIAAFDGPRIVGGGANLDFEMTVPGGVLPTAGVTWISVAPTHRRRGILTEMMRRLLEDAADRGEPLAALWASESQIYGRYGFGLAAQDLRFKLEKSRAQLLHDPPAGVTIRSAGPDEARPSLKAVYDTLRPNRPGLMGRNDAWWDKRLLHTDKHNSRFVVVSERAGQPTGYAIYVAKVDWDVFPEGKVQVNELMAIDDDSYAALWKYLIDLDLLTVIQAEFRPLDEPLRWMLRDPRRMVANVLDATWVRVLDVPKALSGRKYSASGELVMEVVDGFRPASGGRFALRVGPDGVECSPSKSKPDLQMSAADLGAAYLGGVTFSVLAAAGRVQEQTPGALRTADLMFDWHPAPWCPMVF